MYLDMKIIQFEVPDYWHTNLKIAAIRQNKTLTGFIRELLLASPARELLVDSKQPGGEDE